MKASYSIEILESRIAPAAVFFYTDVDGDAVTVKTSKGTDAQLEAITHPFLVAAGLGAQLQKIDFSLDPTHFLGTDITITAHPQFADADKILDGDGHANIGFINATGINLGKVTVNGDLGKIEAGNAGGVPAIKTLTVH